MGRAWELTEPTVSIKVWTAAARTCKLQKKKQNKKTSTICRGEKKKTHISSPKNENRDEKEIPFNIQRGCEQMSLHPNSSAVQETAFVQLQVTVLHQRPHPRHTHSLQLFHHRVFHKKNGRHNLFEYIFIEDF